MTSKPSRALHANAQKGSLEDPLSRGLKHVGSSLGYILTPLKSSIKLPLAPLVFGRITPPYL